MRWLKFAHILLHPWTFKLKNTIGIATLKQLIRLHIIQWNQIQLNHIAGGFLNQLDRILHDGKRTQTQEVHFE